jgi:hypothetical protein
MTSAEAINLSPIELRKILRKERAALRKQPFRENQATEAPAAKDSAISQPKHSKFTPEAKAKRRARARREKGRKKGEFTEMWYKSVSSRTLQTRVSNL